ncbi:DNA polymerase [Candidatus Poriferisodalis sp.]|uniref:DNA polymerase n=1 Tax=Candidatus Poriferisodalis sp. TaxID=3101277 RepID=UPI003B028212
MDAAADVARASADLRRLDPRPEASRDPAQVPITVVGRDGLGDFSDALRASAARAMDTETDFEPREAETRGRVPKLRVISAATRAPDGTERAWVVDVGRHDLVELATALHEGLRVPDLASDAWNATFDDRVIDTHLMEPATAAGAAVGSLRWWDAQLADALLHQGLTGFSFFHGLAWAAERYLGLSVEGKATTQFSFGANGPLSDRQVAYAAADAVETLWVSDVLRVGLRDAGLEEVCRLEQAARPFLDRMERAGLPFDVQGWEAELAELASRRVEVLTHLAELTGGGQGDLFGGGLEPSWNPDSEQQARDVLNRFASDEVEAWTTKTDGRTRPLAPTDSLGASVLAGIGGELCRALLAYRDLSKTLSTYGYTMAEHLWADGRLHPEYLQVVGTNTGRLASRNPNAQNFTPRLKPYMKPPTGRVFVYSDLSQAELRFATQLAGDDGLRTAFEQGLDIHTATAERMFGVRLDGPAGLAALDRPRYEEFRTKAKRINFGILYGQRGAGLSRGLTDAGVPTSRGEADALIEAYLSAYPGIAHWVDERDRFIGHFAATSLDADWPLTLRLGALWPRTDDARRTLRSQQRRHHSAEEVHEALLAAERAGAIDPGRFAGGPTIGLSEIDVAEVAWALSFSAPVIVRSDGSPLSFSSHTPAGRRQQFTFSVDWVLGEAAAVVGCSTKPRPAEVWQRVLARFDLAPPTAAAGGTLRPAVDKVLEQRHLRRAVIDEVGVAMGDADQQFLLRRALHTRVGQMANAYRNAPIQGGVADVMLDAYGRLSEVLARYPTADAVQTVHDSVVIECDEADAHAIAADVKQALEAAMSRWCPDVPTVADTDIRTSLSETSILEQIS